MIMKIKFIKKHPAGIEKGRIVEAQPGWAEVMIQQKYAEEVTEGKAKAKKNKEDKTAAKRTTKEQK